MTRAFFAAILCLAAPAALAETIACPDLSAAAQVGSCPTPQELKWGFTGYCSDNARMTDKDAVTCTSIEEYKKLKDVALWEAGEFQGYLHCSLPAATVKASKPSGVKVDRAGTMNRVTCSYDNDVALSWRTRKSCRAEGTTAVCE
ncbi:MAG: hypothetical protein AB1918_09940 [Pseudomonadota bacterium]